MKRERLERLTELQRGITAGRYETRIGRSAPAIVDRVDPERGGSIARLAWQADDIDGITYLDEPLAPGTLAEVAVQEVVDDYDFRASLIRIASHPASLGHTPRTHSRELPMHASSVGSYGR